MAEGTTTVQALELQIKSNAMGASSSLTALATSLGKIKEKIAGGLNLGNVATEIGKFVTNLKSIGTNDDIDRITKLTNSITGLVNAMKNLSGVKGGTAALKQAVDSTSAVKEYVGKHVGSEYVGRNENASYVGRHEAAGLREAAQDAAKVAEMAATTAKNETVSAEEASKMTSALAESAAKARETQMAILAMADSLKGVSGGGAKTEITIAQQALGTMLKYADDLYGSGQLNATAWRAVRQEIQGIDWGEGNPTSVMDPIEGKAWVLAVAKDAMSEMATSAASASESTATIGDGMAATESKTEAVKEEFHEVATAAEGAKASVDSTGKEAEKSASKLETLRSAVDSLKHSFKDLTKHGVLGFLNSMIRVAKYRMYRALIRNITEGFSTGLKNLREYSKAVDNLYNKDMTGLDNSLLKMKNSLGAVLGSAIQSLIPLFQQLSQWVITASNYINQFIALLSGRNTWTRAVDVVAADFEKTKKSAAGAAKETKNLLAAWDELNIIQSQGGNGGGGSGNKDDIDYTKMFEEVDEFDNGIKDAVQFVQDNLDAVYALVGLIVGKMMGFKTWTVALALSATLSFKAGEDAALEGQGFLDGLTSNLEGIVTGALGGLLLGWTATHTGAGAIAGLTVGLAISTIAYSIGWIKGDEAVRGEKAFANVAPYYIGNIVGTALAGMILGWSVAGIKGAMIGLSIGAAVGIGASILNWEKTDKTDFDATSFGEALAANAVGIISLSGAGAALGAKAGGVPGALIGFTIGAAVAIVATKITADAEASRIKLEKARKSAYGSAHATDEMIKEMVKDFFHYDVDVYLDITGKTISDLRERRNTAIAKITALNNSFTMRARLGWASATPAEIKQLKDDAEGVVSDVNDYLATQNAFIKAHFALTGDLTGENGEIVEAFLENNTILSKYVTQLGADIGRELEKGVKEGFNEDLLADLQEALSNVTLAIMRGKKVGEVKGKVQELEGKYGVNELDVESREQFEKEYKELEAQVKETAWQDAREVQSDLYGQWAGLEAMYQDEYVKKGLAYTDEAQELKKRVDAAKTRAESFNLAKEADDLYNLYIAPGRELHDKLIMEQNRATTDSAAKVGGIIPSAIFDAAWENSYTQHPEFIDTIGKWIVNTTGWTKGEKADTALKYLDETLTKVAYDVIGEEMTKAALDSGLYIWGMYGDDAKESVYEYFNEYGLGKEFAEQIAFLYHDYTFLLDEYMSSDSKYKDSPELLMELFRSSSKGNRNTSGLPSWRTNSFTSDQKDEVVSYLLRLGADPEELNQWLKKYGDARMETDEKYAAYLAGQSSEAEGTVVEELEEAAEELNEAAEEVGSSFAAGALDRTTDYVMKNAGGGEVADVVLETLEEGTVGQVYGTVAPVADTPVAPPGAPTYDESADDDSATETAQAEQTTVLRGMLTVLQQLLNKEVTARFVPSAAAGAAVQQAIRMAERMSG